MDGRLERLPSRDRWGNPLHERRIKVIEGSLVAKSSASAASRYSVGDRVFHQKFGNGTVAEVDGEKLSIDFDRAGRKRVVDSFVSPTA
jgi:DNA helicase-2/ATP-dependent DNA helicase PcrA